jgi:hypothetical protein
MLHVGGGRPLLPPGVVDDDGVAARKRWAGKRRQRGRGRGQGSGGHFLKAVSVVWAPSV